MCVVNRAITSSLTLNPSFLSTSTNLLQRYGYEEYSYLTNYNLLPAAQLATAYLWARQAPQVRIDRLLSSLVHNLSCRRLCFHYVCERHELRHQSLAVVVMFAPRCADPRMRRLCGRGRVCVRPAGAQQNRRKRW